MKARRQQGFALPTILIAAVVMLIVLISAVSATASVRNSLDQQMYVQLANEAAESGIVRAIDCLKSNNYTPTWTSSYTTLWPNAPCAGWSYTCVDAGTCLLQSKPGYRVTFRVYQVTSYRIQGDSQLVTAEGRVDILRPNGTVQREIQRWATARVGLTSSVDDVDAIIFGQ